MKAKIKETGEIVNIENYTRIVLSKRGNYGDPLELPLEEVEIIQNNVDSIDWEERRYEIAKDVTCVMLKIKSESYYNMSDDTIIENVMTLTDELIKQLKNK